MSHSLMEFDTTDELHPSERCAFNKPTSLGRKGGDVGADGRKPTTSLFAHISQQQDAQYSPLRQVTTKIHELYKRCNPTAFSFSSGSNSRNIPPRVLTQPSEPLSDTVPYDNKEGNLIARVYDQISVPGASYHYTIMDLLGTGTFGQVFRCLKEANEPHEDEGGEDEGDRGRAGSRARTPSQVVAVKVVKGKPAYRTQGLLEVKIAKMVNRLGDPEDRHNLVRVLDSFEDRGHVCIVFELLSCSLLDVLTQNQFRGLPLEVVQRFTVQLLAALAVLQDTNIIHCDLKPENILLCPKNNGSRGSGSTSSKADDGGAPPSAAQRGAVDIKVIDFGSACFEGKTMYSYIQSRFYRSPEVLLGVPYNGAIDIWSLGCVCAEMYLGLPLFPGASQHNQLTRIIDMLGDVPDFLVEHGKNSDKFFAPLVPPVIQSSLLPLPFSLPPSAAAPSSRVNGPQSSSSLGSILPAALVGGGMQVSSFMSTLVSGSSESQGGTTGATAALRGSVEGQLRGGTNGSSPHGSKDSTKKRSTNNTHRFRLKTAEEYAADNQLQVPTFRKYLRYDKLDDIVMKCPLPSGTSGNMSNDQKRREHYRRKCFLDFLKGLLHLNPFDRLTARQAMEHPFVAKYFNKKSNIGTIRVKAPTPAPNSPSRGGSNRRSRRPDTSDSDKQNPDKSSKARSEDVPPEYIEKRIFLPPYDDKVKSRVSSYQSKMEEVLSYAVPPERLMGRHNVYLSTMKAAEETAAIGATSASSSAEQVTAEEKPNTKEAATVTSDDTSLDSLVRKTSTVFANGSLNNDDSDVQISPKSSANAPSTFSAPRDDKTETGATGVNCTEKGRLADDSNLPPVPLSQGVHQPPTQTSQASNLLTNDSTGGVRSSGTMGVSPGGLISALLQAAPVPIAPAIATGQDSVSTLGHDQVQQLQGQQQGQAQGYMLPPPPPSSLASSYGSPLTGAGAVGPPTLTQGGPHAPMYSSNLLSQGRGLASSSPQSSSSLPIPMPLPGGPGLHEMSRGKVSGSPYYDSFARRRNSGSGLSRSSNSVLGSFGRTGTGTGSAAAGAGGGSIAVGGGGSLSSSLSGSFGGSLFHSGSSFDFGNFLGSVSTGSSLSSNPPSFPNSSATTPSQQLPPPLQHQQQYTGQSGYTPTNSLSTPAGAYMFGSPSTSSSEFGQALQRPELDESRYLQSFGFQFQAQQQHEQPQHAQQGAGRSDRSKSISESTYRFNPSHNTGAIVGNSDATYQCSTGNHTYSSALTSTGSWMSTASLPWQHSTTAPVASQTSAIGIVAGGGGGAGQQRPAMDRHAEVPVAAALSQSTNSDPNTFQQHHSNIYHHQQPSIAVGLDQVANQNHVSPHNQDWQQQQHAERGSPRQRHSMTSVTSSTSGGDNGGDDEPLFDCDD